MTSLIDPRERVQAARDELFAHLVASLGQHAAWLESHLDDVRRDAKHRWTANLAAREAASIDTTGHSQQAASAPIANLLKSPAKKRSDQQRQHSQAPSIVQPLFTSPFKQQQQQALSMAAGADLQANESEAVYGLFLSSNNDRPIRPVSQARSASQFSQASQSSLLSRSPGKVGGLNLTALQHQQALHSLINSKASAIQQPEQALRRGKTSHDPPRTGLPRSNTQGVLSPSTGSGRHQQRTSPRPPTSQQSSGPFSNAKPDSPIKKPVKSPVKSAFVQPPVASPTPKPTSRFAAAFSRLKQVASPSKHAYNAAQRPADETIANAVSPSKHVAASQQQQQQRVVFGQPVVKPTSAQSRPTTTSENVSPAKNLQDVFTELSNPPRNPALDAPRQFSDIASEDLSDDDDNGEVEDILLGYIGRTPAAGAAQYLTPVLPPCSHGADTRPPSPSLNRPQTRSAAAAASPKATSIPVPLTKASPPRPVRSPARPLTKMTIAASRLHPEESHVAPASPRPAPRNMSNLATIASVLAVPNSAIPLVAMSAQVGAKSPRMSPPADRSSIPRPASPRSKIAAPEPSSRPGSPALRASSRLAAKDTGKDSPRSSRPGSPASNIACSTAASSRSPRLHTILSSNLAAPERPPPCRQASLEIPQRQNSCETSFASEGRSAIGKIVTAPTSPIISPTDSEMPAPAAPASPLRMQLKAQVEAKVNANRRVDQSVPLVDANVQKRALASATSDAQTPMTANHLLGAPNTVRAPVVVEHNKVQVQGTSAIPPSPVFSSMLVGAQAGSSRTNGLAAAFAGKKSLGLGLGLGKSLGAGLGQSNRPSTMNPDGLQSVVPRKRLSSMMQDLDNLPTKAARTDTDTIAQAPARISTAASHAVNGNNKDDDTRARLDMLRNRISVIKSARMSSATAMPGGVRSSIAHAAIPAVVATAAIVPDNDAVAKQSTAPVAPKPTIASSVAALLPASGLGTSFANFFTSSLAGLQSAATGGTDPSMMFAETTDVRAGRDTTLQNKLAPMAGNIVSTEIENKPMKAQTRLSLQSIRYNDVEEILTSSQVGPKDVSSPARPQLLRIVSSSSVHDIVNAYEAKSSAAIAEKQRQHSTSPIVIKQSPQNAKTVPPGFFGKIYSVDCVGPDQSPSKAHVAVTSERRSITTTPPFSPPAAKGRISTCKNPSSPTHITVTASSPHKAATDEVALNIEDELDVDPIVRMTSEFSDNEQGPRASHSPSVIKDACRLVRASGDDKDELPRVKRPMQLLDNDVIDAEFGLTDSEQPPRKKHEVDHISSIDTTAAVEMTLKKSVSASFKPIRPQGLRPPSRAPSAANSNPPRASSVSTVAQGSSKAASSLKTSLTASIKPINDKPAGVIIAHSATHRDLANSQKSHVSANKAVSAPAANTGSKKGKAAAVIKPVVATASRAEATVPRKAPVVEIVVKSSAAAKSMVTKTTVVRNHTVSNIQQSQSKADLALNARAKVVTNMATTSSASSTVASGKSGLTANGHKAASNDAKNIAPGSKIGHKTNPQTVAMSQHEAAKAALAKIAAPNLNKSTTSAKPSARIEPEGFELPDIDSEYSDSDEDEQARKAALRPGWTQSPVLRQALATQASYNPDHLFGSIPTLQMEDIFKDSKSTLARLRLRTSSQHWTGTDALTAYEEQEYARRMGFREHLQDTADS